MLAVRTQQSASLLKHFEVGSRVVVCLVVSALIALCSQSNVRAAEAAASDLVPVCVRNADQCVVRLPSLGTEKLQCVRRNARII